MVKYERWYGRVNCGKVFKAWAEGRSNRSADSVWSNGDHIYSYGTCIVARDGDRVILNRTTYSVTTTRHQNALYTALRQNGFDFVTVEDIRYGAHADDLRERAKHDWREPGVEYPRQETA